MTRVGSYRVLELLARGGVGVVYRAQDERTGSEVALKLLAPDLGTDEAVLRRFQREVRAASAVSHRNVVRVVDSGEFEGRPFAAFEVLPRGSLRDRLKVQGRIAWRDVASVGAQVARGLGAIHAAGLVHRDVSPGNVLFGEDGVPKLADLGLAWNLGDSSELGTTRVTRAGEVVGTLEDPSPEQANGSPEVDERADLYGLGATLFHALTGEPPFQGEGLALVKRHLLEEPRAVRDLCADVPPELSALVARLLEKKPAARGASADAVADELDAIAARSVGTPAWVRALVGAAAVLVLGGALALAWSRPAEPPALPVAAVRLPPRAPAGPPAWFLALSGVGRPDLPLPQGLSFGSVPGEYVNDSDGSVLVFGPASTFEMGRPRSASGVHEVDLSAYFIGKYELTNRQFERFTKSTGYVTSAEKTHGAHVLDPIGRVGRDGRDWSIVATASWRAPAGEGSAAPGDHPVVEVSWDDAVAYTKWAGLRLPSEAEWERAAVWDAGTRRLRRFVWGDDVPGPASPRVANLVDITFRAGRSAWAYGIFEGYDDRFETTAPVGTFPAGASPVGALDMAGNVWELCADGLDASFYARSPRHDPVAPVADMVAVRGGGWHNAPSLYDPCIRGGSQRTEARDDLGFRVAR